MNIVESNSLIYVCLGGFFGGFKTFIPDEKEFFLKTVKETRVLSLSFRKILEINATKHLFLKFIIVI